MAKDKQDVEDKVEGITFTIFSTVLGVILICSFAIPVIFGSAGIGALTDAQESQFGGLIGVIVIALILGLLLPVIKGYNNKR